MSTLLKRVLTFDINNYYKTYLKTILKSMVKGYENSPLPLCNNKKERKKERGIKMRNNLKFVAFIIGLIIFAWAWCVFIMPLGIILIDLISQKMGYYTLTPNFHNFHEFSIYIQNEAINLTKYLISIALPVFSLAIAITVCGIIFNRLAYSLLYKEE